ncbi:hypothetical protein SLS56_004183 [Neofusicoccum ribis]|uniref:Uncharacterized protein n=1 Tax=Neofusicoccum ribis TaxID=45134 RepID=A0ABR3SXA3_9PEZI
MSDSPQATLSPPTTPPKQRKRKPDPFLDLANSPIASPLASPHSAEHDAAPAAGDEPFLKKLVLTPLLFTSFILSLLIVDRRNRAYRLAEHPPSGSSSWWTRFSPWKWLDPQPYQNPGDSTWQDASAGQTQGSDGSIPGVDGQAELDRGKQARKQWFVSKKHRKVAKMHFSDAFDMRWKIMVALGIAWTLGILALLWSAKKLARVVW